MRQFSRLLAAALAVALMPAARASNDFTVLYNFTGGTDGGLVTSFPVLDSQGNLYGATYWGGTGTGCGSNGCGVLFQITPQGDGEWNENVLFDFNGQYNTGFPDGGVVLDSAGDLYGTTAGGPNGTGTVFELTPASGGWTYSLLYTYGGGCLVPDHAGNLFGCIGSGEFGDGAIGELSPGSNGWTYASIYSFCNPYSCPNGEDPLAPLSWDASGDLFGTTYFGGNANSGNGMSFCIDGLGCGVAFELSRNRAASSAVGLWSYHVIHRFASTATDGQNPNGGLTLDAQGNAYGTTPVGGPACLPVGCGTVFELTPGPGIAPGFWRETILYDFPAAPNCSQGCAPGSNLLFDQAGNLYGVAGGGNSYCAGTCGVVFKLTAQANGQWTYTLVHEFNGTDGANPLGLAIDANGNLFGTTKTGGAYGLGVVFEITP